MVWYGEKNAFRVPVGKTDIHLTSKWHQGPGGQVFGAQELLNFPPL